MTGPGPAKCCPSRRSVWPTNGRWGAPRSATSAVEPLATPPTRSRWLGASAQRTGINVEAKLLLLIHAFETLQVSRVDIKTDARNERVRAAILALGARFEGVLRRWQPSQAVGEEDRLRDTAMYSIVDGEWPSVRDHLRSRLGRAAAGS